MGGRATEIAERLRQVRSEIPPRVTLIVVTKNFPNSDLEILFELGERDFGENRVQELVTKRDSLDHEISNSVRWHFQGAIQSNKIALLNDYADVIHSVDSEKVISRLSPEKEAFLQINLDASEVRDRERSGIEPVEVERYAGMMKERFGEKFLGVMGVAPHFPGISVAEIDASFTRLEEFSRRVRKVEPRAVAISAGMSDDFRLALGHGATHIRLGSSILGQRG